MKTRRSVLHYSVDQTFHIEGLDGFYARNLP
ncbi:hypothetical protein M2336_001649 [Sphingobium sp. B1D7B]|nr:hypothetical protein [Sphingobium sp. B1D7B]